MGREFHWGRAATSETRLCDPQMQQPHPQKRMKTIKIRFKEDKGARTRIGEPQKVSGPAMATLKWTCSDTQNDTKNKEMRPQMSSKFETCLQTSFLEMSLTKSLFSPSAKLP